MTNSNYANHTALDAYLRWHIANHRHPNVVAARRERARVRGEHHRCVPAGRVRIR